MENIHPLKTYRETQEPPLSQGDLADLLGVSRETVTRWESGARKIEPAKLDTVARKTGIAKGDLRPDLAAIFTEAAE